MDQKTKIIVNYLLNKLNNNEAIQLKEPNDCNFSNIAQNAFVSGATLPSGLKIPDDGIWTIYGNFVIKNHQTDINLQDSISSSG